MTISTLLVTLLMTHLWRHCDANFTLTLIHTNDVHSRFEQFNKDGTTCSQEDADAGNCFGGYARLKTAVDEIRKENPHSLLLDAGDQFQGTLWFYEYGGTVIQQFMNWLNYSAMALGNHEFDNQVSGLVPFLQNVSFPVVSCNMDASEEPAMQGLFTRSHEFLVAGHRVAVVGYTTASTPQISSPGKLNFHDVVNSVEQEVERLKGDGVKVIIALGHAGYTKDQQLASIPGVDVVIGGHSHSFLYTGIPPSDEEPVGDYPTVVERETGSRGLVVQCYTMAKYVCVLNVTFDAEGEIVSYDGAPRLQHNSVIQDNETLSMLAPWRAGIQELKQRVVGRSLVTLEGDRNACRRRECNMGNLITDAMLYKNLRQHNGSGWSDVSIAIVNAGGIRSSIPKGNITVADILSVLPFGNFVDAILIEGKYLRQALEYCAANVKVSSSEDAFGGFLQVSGLRIQYNLHKPEGQRVVSVQALCTECEVPGFKPLEDGRVYKVVLSNFVARGGDGYTMLRDHRLRYFTINDVDSDVLREYLQDFPPVYHSEENRIQFLSPEVACDDTSGAAGPQSQNRVGETFVMAFVVILGLLV